MHRIFRIQNNWITLNNPWTTAKLSPFMQWDHTVRIPTRFATLCGLKMVEVTIPKAWHNCQAFQALFLGSRRMDISEVLLDSLTGRLFICLKLASGTSYTKTPKMYAKKTHMIIYVYMYIHIRSYKQWFPAILLLSQAVRMKGVWSHSKLHFYMHRHHRGDRNFRVLSAGFSAKY
jgi:hypothetical protein